MPNPIYRVFIKNPSSTEIVELQPKSWSFIDELNKESTIKLSVSHEEVQKIADTYNSTNLAIFTTALREIYVERNGTKVFYGVVTDYQVAPDGQGGKSIDVTGVSWFGLLNKRRAGIPVRIFSAQDAAVIAWTLINESQQSDPDGGGGYYSDYGITQGAHPTTKNRDRTYRFDNIKEAIYRLSNNNLKDGFDFDIDTAKAFNVYYPTKGSTKADIVLDEHNLATWRYKKPLLGTLTNRVYVKGAGQNDDLLYVTRTAGTTPRSTWKTQDEVLNETEIIETATLNDKGDVYLTNNQDPVPEFSAEHYENRLLWTDYGLGDTIKVNLPDIGLTLTSMRVYKREFVMDAAKSIGYIKTSLK